MPTKPTVAFTIDGKAATAPANCSVAVALLVNDVTQFRTSVSGEPRGAFCGMGVCYECRVTIDGRPHQKSCQIVLAPGMEVRTRD